MRTRKFDKIAMTEDLERWYNSMKRGSPITADVNIRRLEAFCTIMHVTPDQLTKMDTRKLYNLLMDFVTHAENQKFSPNYISSILKGVKSWLSHMDRDIKKKIKITRAGVPVTVRNETIPTQEQLKRILQSADTRERAAVSLMAFSGLRPEVLGDYRRTDGLTIADIPDLDITNKKVSFTNIPARIMVREELSKSSKPYFTFLGPEGCSYLTAYLEERLNSSEILTKDSPVIVASKAALRNRFIRTINISDIIRGPIRGAGFQWRPYVLRGFFDTNLLMAESKTGLPRDYRVFWMGHSGTMEAKYTTDKILPESVNEDMRNAYSKSLKFLETEIHGIKEEDLTKQLRETTIMTIEMALGVKFSNKDREDLAAMDTEDFQARIREISDKQRESMKSNGFKNRTISTRELDDYLDSGYELVSFYPKGDKAIVRILS